MEKEEGYVRSEVHAVAWHQAVTIETGSIACVAPCTTAVGGASAAANATNSASAICPICVGARTCQPSVIGGID